jgi:hypothetical protein
VRRDLGDGFREAQLAHAIGQSLDEPHPDGMFVVVLAARDEDHLRSEADRLEREGVALSRVVEDDGPLAGQLTAVGLRPGRKGVVGRHVSCLPRLR